MASRSCFIMMATMAVLLHVSGAESEILLQKGARELLPCEVEGNVSIAAWNKEPSIYDTSYLISGGYSGGMWQKGGPGYDAGMYDIAKNFSLIIEHVDKIDNGQFVCTATTVEPRSYLTSKVNVSVFASPRTPFPSIQECPQNTTWTDEDCNLFISSPLDITCSVFEYFPNITLYFRLNSTKLDSSHTDEWENTDGTINKEITITAEANDIPYTCVAEDIPGFGILEQVINIYLNAEPEQKTTEDFTTVLSTDTAKGNDNINYVVKSVIVLVVVIVITPAVILVAAFLRKKYPNKCRRAAAVTSVIDEPEEIRTKKISVTSVIDEPEEIRMKKTSAVAVTSVIDEPEEIRMKKTSVTSVIDEPEEIRMKKTSAQSLPSDLQTLKAELKRSYRLEYSEVLTSPLDPKSLRKLEQIYVHLVLLGEGTNRNPESDYDYDALFKMFARQQEKARILLIGEAGAGKSTLLTRIAYDWAVGERLEDVSLLFLVRLRKMGKCSKFDEIPQLCLVHGKSVGIESLYEYMNNNPREVMFLLDGLDEWHGVITVENSSDVLAGLMSGDKLNRAPVIVTTRPWRADQITSVDQINKKYTRIRVEGFEKHNVQEYIQRYFKDDTESAKSLIHLVTEESVIAKTMAPYPIFCSMLCHMWKWNKVSDRERVKKLQTFSELIQEMVNALVEQYASKIYEKGISGYTCKLKACQDKCQSSFERIGEVAFRGLLVKKIAFDEEEFTDSMKDIDIGCQVGVLSSKKRFAPNNIIRTEGRDQLAEVSFPHKLLQEYLAGLYFASLYLTNKNKFERLLREEILPSPREYAYLLYFTAAHGKGPGQAGQPLIQTLCDALTIERDNSNSYECLTVEMAFECQDDADFRPVVDLLLQKTSFCLGNGFTDHRWSGYMFIFSRCGYRMIETNSQMRSIVVDEARDQPSHDAAFGLFTLPKLRTLELRNDHCDKSFFAGMVNAASFSMIEELSLSGMTVDNEASEQCARGVFSMTKLRSLKLEATYLDDGFFSVMSESASQSPIEKLSLVMMNLGREASEQCAGGIFTMTKLRSLKLVDMKLDDGFFSVMSESASQSQIEELSLREMNLGREASEQCARGVFSMTKLRSLELYHMELDDGFFSVMLESASQSQIKELSLDTISLGREASELCAQGVFTITKLRSLKLDDMRLNDGFFSVMTETASQSQIEDLCLIDMNLGRETSEHFARGLFTMTKLRSLELVNTELDDGYSSVMSKSASQAQGFEGNNVTELPVNNESVPGLCQLGLHEACPRVNKLTLSYSYWNTITAGLIKMVCSSFPQLTELHMKSPNDYAAARMPDITTFCSVVVSACPRLIKLSFTRMRIGNDEAAEILQRMKAHSPLKNITMERCDTNELELDQLCEKINREGNIHVSVTHGRI